MGADTHKNSSSDDEEDDDDDEEDEEDDDEDEDDDDDEDEDYEDDEDEYNDEEDMNTEEEEEDPEWSSINSTRTIPFEVPPPLFLLSSYRVSFIHKHAFLSSCFLCLARTLSSQSPSATVHSVLSTEPFGAVPMWL